MKSDNNCLIHLVSKCSNHDQKKMPFSRLNQACAVLSTHFRTLTVFIGAGSSNDSYSDVMNLPIGDWLYPLVGVAYFAILHVLPFIVIRVHSLSVHKVLLGGCLQAQIKKIKKKSHHHNANMWCVARVLLRYYGRLQKTNKQTNIYNTE